MTQVNLTDRTECVANSIDPSGRTWKIYPIRGSHMFCARPDPDRSDAVIPENLVGRWTSSVLLKEQIERYLELSWDASEKQEVKNRRAEQAAAEQAKKKVSKKNAGKQKTKERL